VVGGFPTAADLAVDPVAGHTQVEATSPDGLLAKPNALANPWKDERGEFLPHGPHDWSPRERGFKIRKSKIVERTSLPPTCDRTFGLLGAHRSAREMSVRGSAAMRKATTAEGMRDVAC